MDDRRKDHIDKKKQLKGTVTYRPIMCLPMMWKIETAQIREEIYDSLTSRGLLPEGQIVCRKVSRSIGELLYFDQYIIVMMPLNHVLRKFTAGYKLSKSSEKMNDIKLCKKRKRIEDSNTRNRNIQSWREDGIWYRKMYHACNKKQKTTH